MAAINDWAGKAAGAGPPVTPERHGTAELNSRAGPAKLWGAKPIPCSLRLLWPAVAQGASQEQRLQSRCQQQHELWLHL